MKKLIDILLFYFSGYLILMGISMMYAISEILKVKLDFVAYFILALVIYSVYTLNRLVESELDAKNHSERFDFL